MNKELPWFQSWFSDWESPAFKGLSLSAKGLLREMEGLACRGKPTGHVTWPSGCAIDIASMARLANEAEEVVTDLISVLQIRGVIGVGKSGAFIIHHIVKREATRKKRQKSGKIGADVTNCNRKEKIGLPRQMLGNPLSIKSIEDRDRDVVDLNVEPPNTAMVAQQQQPPNAIYFNGKQIKLSEDQYNTLFARYSFDKNPKSFYAVLNKWDEKAMFPIRFDELEVKLATNYRYGISQAKAMTGAQ